MALFHPRKCQKNRGHVGLAGGLWLLECKMADLREDELEAMLSSLDSRDFHSPVSGDGLGARELASGAKRPGEPEPEPRIGWRDLRRLERQPLGPAAEGAGAAPGSAGSEQNMGFEGALGSESGLRSAGGGAESAVTERLSQASSEQSREDVVSFQGTDAAGGRGAARSTLVPRHRAS